MVSTSARNAGGPWFDSRSRHNRLLYDNSVCLYIYKRESNRVLSMNANHHSWKILCLTLFCVYHLDFSLVASSPGSQMFNLYSKYTITE